MKRKSLFLVALLLVGLINESDGCFILFLSDGRHVLVGNHEDWFAKDAALKINPPSKGKFGSVIFAFSNEGWAQGGMNEKGLFFDAARTPFQEIAFPGESEEFPGYIWQSVLDKCATVAEALTFLSKYKIPELSEAHIMLADATGDAVIIGVDHGKIAFKRPQQTYLLQTNFNPWNPELSDDPVCRRYNRAERDLAIKKEATVENLKSILEQTHQDSLTVYSNIYDLKNKIIYTYNKRNFSRPIRVRLPELFAHGHCMVALDSLERDSLAWKNCVSTKRNAISISGKIRNAVTSQPIPFANIGMNGQNIGTLSDPDGSFELVIPFQKGGDSILISSIGFLPKKISIRQLRYSNSFDVKLLPSSKILDAVIIRGKKSSAKIKRLGWMGGKDGILPFDTVQGGGAVALLVQTPSIPCRIEKLQVRLMYNSKDTTRLRLHFFAFDSVNNLPTRELLVKEIILKETKRFGWLRFDLSRYEIVVNEKKFLIGFEWIDDRSTRKNLLAGFLTWEEWKKEQYALGNKRVERTTIEGNNQSARYKYHGNMMDWPGFKKLPPFTGLMVDTGKNEKTIPLKTFVRKTSFGTWYETNSTLNAVVTVSY
jgi:hypothetical protein